MQKVNQRYEKIRQYLKPGNEKYVKEQIEHQRTSECPWPRRDNLSEAEKEDFNIILKLWEMEEYFSDKVDELQRLAIIQHGLIDFDAHGKFSLKSLTEKIHKTYIPEHLSEDGTFNRDREIFFTDARALFEKHGDDMKLTDVLDNGEFDIIQSLAPKNLKFNLKKLTKDGVNGLFYEEMRLKRGSMVNYMTCEFGEELSHTPSDEIVSKRTDKHTPKGRIVDALYSELYISDQNKKTADKLVRDISDCKDWYFPPHSYDRIIRDYYDETCGFKYVGIILIKRRGALSKLKLLPQYVDVGSYPEYENFRDELIEQKLLSKDQANEIEKYLQDEIEKAVDEVIKQLYLFPFLIYQFLAKDHREVHNQYQKEVTDIIHTLSNLTEMQNNDKRNASEYRADANNKQQSIQEKKAKLLLSKECSESPFNKKINKEISQLRKEQRNLETKASRTSARVHRRSTRLGLLMHDLKVKIDQNMLFACVFYSYIFDGETKLRRQPLGRGRPPETLINNIVVYLMKLWENRMLKKLAYEQIRQFIKMLIGYTITDVRSLYRRVKNNRNPLI